MSEQNKAIVRRYLDEVFAQGNFDVIPELVDPDYVEHDPASDGEIRGHDGVRRDLTIYQLAFADVEVVVGDQIAEGALVATRMTVRATQVEDFHGVPPSGNRVTVTGTVIMRVSDGRLAEGWWNWDTLGLLRQIGALPAEQVA
jgi:steroid delta-isomerase-like uncharacterized protein